LRFSNHQILKTISLSKQESHRAVADKDSDSCLKLRFSNHQILKTNGYLK
jgi:hypothetical protein